MIRKVNPKSHKTKSTKSVKKDSGKKKASTRRVKKVNTPFGYFGSKNTLALKLFDKLPPHSCWVEVFCGSAALTLSKLPAPIEIINDVDEEIVNFFRQLRNNPKKLCEKLVLTPYSSSELKQARLLLNKTRLTKVERARLFLIQSMMAVNGIFGKDKGGFSHSNSYTRENKEARVSRWCNLPERLQPVIERLRAVRIENRDGIDLLRSFVNRPGTLCYLDPPYFADRTNGYNIDANTRKFHLNLLRLANKSKCMIFISGYPNSLYDSILTKKRGWHSKSIDATTKDVSGNSHKRTEVVWMNKFFMEALKSNTPPVVLSKAEKKNKKVNPERKRKNNGNKKGKTK